MPSRRVHEPHSLSRQRRILFSHEETDYVLVRTLEQAPHGAVSLASVRHGSQQGGLVEVRELRPSAPAREHQRLEEEFRLATWLTHPSIIRIQGLHRQPDGTRYLVTEHVPGYWLETVISFGQLRGRPLSESFALYVAAEVAGALHAAHTLTDAAGQPLGLLHRDVNPANIRIAQEGEVKLSGFVAAFSRLPGRWETTYGVLRGDLAYAAPERLEAHAETGVDVRADLFSLGLVLLETLTARHLYDMEEIEQQACGQKAGAAPGMAVMRAEVESWVSAAQMARRATAVQPRHVEQATRGLSEPTRAILHKLLQRDPARRYTSGAELQAALRDRLARSGLPHGRGHAARELTQASRSAEGMRRKANPLESGACPPGYRVGQGEDASSRG
jgi:serine/threonine-protein kinase